MTRARWKQQLMTMLLTLSIILCPCRWTCQQQWRFHCWRKTTASSWCPLPQCYRELGPPWFPIGDDHCSRSCWAYSTLTAKPPVNKPSAWRVLKTAKTPAASICFTRHPWHMAVCWGVVATTSKEQFLLPAWQPSSECRNAWKQPFPVCPICVLSQTHSCYRTIMHLI